MDANNIRLRRTTFTVTLRCTLNCKKCSADVINYLNPPHYSCSFIEKELKQYFNIVDHVTWLQYSGGEPIMNAELPQMIEKAMNYSDKFDKLMIFTNGTLLPTDEMIRAFCKYRDKIQFFFSNYGELSSKGDKIIEIFEHNNIAFEQKKYYGKDMHCGGWVDFGDWEDRNYSEQELVKYYEICSMHTMGFSVVQEGQIHLCRKSYRGMELGVIGTDNSDYLDLFDEKETIQQKREKFVKMLNTPYLQACKYCNATYGDSRPEIRITPAEQLTPEEIRQIKDNLRSKS